MIFLSSQAQELPSILQGKIGLSCRGTLLECRSMSERLVKLPRAGIQFSSKTSLPKTIGLCDQNGRNVRRFAALQGIPSSFKKNCSVFSFFPAPTTQVKKSSLG